MADFDFSGIEAITDAFVSEYKNRLQNADKRATGALIDSVEGIVEYDGRYITIKISAEDYWKYVEYGRKPGKFPPPEALAQWISVKGLPRSNYSAKTGGTALPTEKQLAYLIGRSIAKNGIPAGNYLSDTIESFNLEDKIQREVVNMIRNKMHAEVQEEINTILEGKI